MANENMKEQIAIATIQKDIEYIRASLLEMKTLLGVYATKQELAQSMKEVEQLVYKVEKKLEDRLEPIAEDMQNRKKDRNKMLYYVIAAFLAGAGNFIFTVIKDYFTR